MEALILFIIFAALVSSLIDFVVGNKKAILPTIVLLFTFAGYGILVGEMHKCAKEKNVYKCKITLVPMK